MVYTTGNYKKKLKVLIKKYKHYSKKREHFLTKEMKVWQKIQDLKRSMGQKKLSDF